MVFEVAGTIQRFARAAQGIEGLDFITDFAGEELEPDSEFFFEEDPERTIPQTLYLVMASARAIDQLVRLFEQHQADSSITFETGLAPLKQLFQELHTVRKWGPNDRIYETGLLDAWREDIDVIGENGSVRVEVEIVWRNSPSARAAAEAEVRVALGAGTVVRATTIDSIEYHSVLADLPATQVSAVLDDGPAAIGLMKAKEVLFVFPVSPMSLRLSQRHLPGPSAPEVLPDGPPKVALLDGLPLANHDLLAGRLSIVDPEERSALYSPGKCGHGTAMASLIVHGDLSDPGAPLSTPLHVQPILVPHDFYQDEETTPPDELFVDVVHAAIQRMLGGDEPAAPSVRIINLSIGDPARVFTRRLSPLARLLDYLSFQFNVLIVVSAGNHKSVKPVVPSENLADSAALEGAVRRSLLDQARHRRLLSPAESINAITVGALHADSAGEVDLPDTVIDPLPSGSVAVYSPLGFGFSRSPKPEVHAPGGRQLATRPPINGEDIELEPAETTQVGPGILVAAPALRGSTSGVVYDIGTSHAAALTTRSAHGVLETLETLAAAEPGTHFADQQYHPVLVKALLVHAAVWPDESRDWADQLGAQPQSRRRVLTQHLGFGAIRFDRLANASTTRACLVGAGSIGNNKRHSFRFPLPPSLATNTCWRRLTVTLAWLSPIVPTSQQYRVAHLSFGSPRDVLRVKPTQVDHNCNGRGTVLHEVLEGETAAGYTRDATLAIDVDCRVRVGRLTQQVRFALVASLEVAAEIETELDIHAEVQARLREEARVAAQARARGG